MNCIRKRIARNGQRNAHNLDVALSRSLDGKRIGGLEARSFSENEESLVRSLGLGVFGSGQRDLDSIGLAKNNRILDELLVGEPAETISISKNVALYVSSVP